MTQGAPKPTVDQTWQQLLVSAVSKNTNNEEFAQVATAMNHWIKTNPNKFDRISKNDTEYSGLVNDFAEVFGITPASRLLEHAVPITYPYPKD